MRALLALEDGTVWTGRAFGSSRPVGGEVVFNTSMTGYQEILTDPSYHGQMVVFTAPHLGNYGIHEDESEAAAPNALAAICREVCETAAHPSARQTVGAFLKEHERFGLTEVDTRALTLHLRKHGCLRGWLTTRVGDVADAVARARRVPPMDQVAAVPAVTTRSAYSWTSNPRPGAPRVAVLDCGVKYNILRELARHGADVTVLPADTGPEEIERLCPDGIVLSNGPGDPGALAAWTPRIDRLLRRYPTLAICLGHQLVSMTLGCRIVRLPFGHHGGNHPVKELETGRVLVTAQNHNYAVDPGSLPGDLDVTHLNLNDGTVEGVRHQTLPLWSLQFHPEAAPGPHDAVRLFDQFVAAIEKGR